MGKKNKKEKGKGAEKAAQKLAKKDRKEEGMEDLEAMIAQFKEDDKLKTTFSEEQSSHPSPRTNLSVSAHPEKEELIFFGGEYFNGKKTTVFNDLFVYNIKKLKWTKQNIPNPPPPRCAHQAVTVAKDGGQLWIFGGEFASPNNMQFDHYKDLWVLNLKEHKWDHIKAPGGPSQRSGHRMVLYKQNLFVFGGFHEGSKNFIYFNDCYLFSLSDYTWTKLNPTGTGPSPRSACQLAVVADGVLVIGGYSKVRVNKEVDKGTAHSDIFLLREKPGTKWVWEKVKDSGNKPWPRSGFSVVPISPTRVGFFGGVCDDEDDEEIKSLFFNSMHCLDTSSFRWFNVEFYKKGKKDDENEKEVEKILPCPRMNSPLVVKKHTMFLFGGVIEEGDKQVTLNDLWSIDLRKLNSWNQILESDDTGAEWFEEEDSSSSSSDEEMEVDQGCSGIQS